MDDGRNSSQDSLELLELERFDTAFAVGPDRDAATKRRFMTLFVESSPARNFGSSGYVARARNAMGETFAVKRLRSGYQNTPLPGGQRPQPTPGQIAAFREEYRTQLQLSHMKGFPRLYGMGESAGEPVIVMEWIQGETLASLRFRWPQGARPGSAQPDAVAALGCAIFSILEGLDRLADRPVHRDLSPSNIMVRTDARTFEEQVAVRDFDLCLIDFGSATLLDRVDARFTMVANVWRNGTPEYAPPEMLTHDIANIEVLRQSPSIDVYAASSILYELLMGHTPYRVGEQATASPYRLKMDTAPEPVDGAFGVLAQAIMAGLQKDQAMRPTATEMLAYCNSFLGIAASAASTPAPSGPLPAMADFGMAHLSMPVDAGAHAGQPQPQTTYRQMQSQRPGVTAPVQGAQPLRPKSGGRLVGRRGFIAGIVAIAGVAAVGGAAAYFGLAGKNGDAAGQGEAGAGTDAGAGADNGAGAGNDAGAGTSEGGAGTGATQQTAPYTGGTLLLAQDTDTRLWGYLNSQRAWVIAPRFEETPGFFSEGLAQAKDPDTGLYGYLNYDGSWAIKPSYRDARGFGEDGLALAVSGPDAARQGLQDNRIGWIDKTGAWAIEPTYISAGQFNNGLAAYSDPAAEDASHSWGYLDTNGVTVLAPSFYDASAFADNGLAAAAEHVSLWGFIDRDGKWVIEPKYSQVGSFHEGIAAVFDTWEGRWGFVDETGAQAIPCTFKDARNFSDGRAAVQDAATGLWGYIGPDGSWLLKPKFGRLGEISHGLAPAQDADTQLFGYIDDQGEWVIPPQFLSVGLAALE